MALLSLGADLRHAVQPLLMVDNLSPFLLWAWQSFSNWFILPQEASHSSYFK
jgi:hypothetical protein